MNSTIVKAELLAYWRYIRQCPLVGVECFDQDVLVVTKSRSLVICEVKTSISDLRADGGKEFHFRAAKLWGIKKEPKNHKEFRAAYKALYARDIPIPNQFYFAVPTELEEKALAVIEERYPYTGLIVVAHYPEQHYWGYSVAVSRIAPFLHKEKCGIKTISVLVKSISASLASAYKALVKAQKIPVETQPKEVL